ncbi:hypothetical protein WEI85_12650 [Actinomycetes bacterium KLBMP 9797]
MEGERWYGDRSEPEWEGYRIPGPRGGREGFEADPLTAAMPYGLADPGYPLAPPIPAPPPGPSPVSPPVQPAPAPMPGPVPGPVPTPAPPRMEPPQPPQPPQQPQPPQPDPLRQHTEQIDRTALRRPGSPVAPVGDGVYRTKRPAVALAFLGLTVVFEVLALLLLIDGVAGGAESAGALVSGLFLAVGLPMFAIGLYALVTGATRLPPEAGGGLPVWLRPPVAYLPVSLVLFLAAALAAGP